MAIVDTSVLVPSFDKAHPRHAEALAALRRESVVAVCGGILEETTRIVRRSAIDAGLDGNGTARQALAQLRGLPSYRLVGDYDETATAARFDGDPRLSYVDAWGIQVALDSRQELLTFDDHQRRAWRKARGTR